MGETRQPVRIFIHGLESSNQGTKALFFRRLFPDMLIPFFRGDLGERMAQLESVLRGRHRLCLVGSSFGGLMATLFALQDEARVERMVLLAPALNLLPFAAGNPRRVAVPVAIYHGTADEVIPLDRVEPVARSIFDQLCFHVVADDHFLHRTFKRLPWAELLGSD